VTGSSGHARASIIASGASGNASAYYANQEETMAHAEAMLSMKRVARFLWTYKGWPLLLPILFVVGMLVHGAFAAAAILVQGGTVELVLLRLGFWYQLGPSTNPWTIILTPVAAWIWVAAFGALLVRRLPPGFLARLLSVFFCALPSLAISGAFSRGVASPRAAPYFDVLPYHLIISAVVAGVILCWLGILAWWPFRRAWGAALSKVEFAIGYLLLMALPWVVFATLPPLGP
jgi:hypothetical protein